MTYDNNSEHKARGDGNTVLDDDDDDDDDAKKCNDDNDGFET